MNPTTKLPSNHDLAAQLIASGDANMVEHGNAMRDAIDSRTDLIADKAERRDFVGALVFASSDEVADMIVDFDDQYRLTDIEAREVLLSEWTRMEARGHRTAEILGLLRRANRAGGPLVDDLAPALPKGTIQLYRGNLGEDPTLGLSWTRKAAKAEWFCNWITSTRGQLVLGLCRADGKRGVQTVWQASCPPDAILGMFYDRGEFEVVPDPDRLKNIRAIREAVS